MNIAFFSPLRGISSQSNGMNSHNAGWYLTYAKYLQSKGHTVDVWPTKDLAEYDQVVVCHSVDTETQVITDSFSLNLFGGANGENAAGLSVLSRADVNFVSFYIDCPDYGTAAKGRLKSCTDGWKAVDWDKITEVCSNMKTVGYESSHLVIGDSHSFSVWIPGAACRRLDGTTLFGTLKRGLSQFLPEGYDKYTIYLGNIDVRHHLGRQSDPLKAVEKLANDYIAQSIEYAETHGCQIELVNLLPVECESRKIPKTGWYKAQNELGKKEARPFWGSREVREQMVSAFNRILNSTTHPQIEVYRWPDEWYNRTSISPEWFFNQMEKPRSVHLAPKSYRSDVSVVDSNDGLQSLFNV